MRVEKENCNLHPRSPCWLFSLINSLSHWRYPNIFKRWRIGTAKLLSDASVSLAWSERGKVPLPSKDLNLKSEEINTRRNLGSIGKTYILRYFSKKRYVNKFSNSYKHQFMFSFQRWVWAFRQDRLQVAVNTNDGLERQNEDFKYNHLANHRDKSLSGMLSVLITDVFTRKVLKVICSSVITEHWGAYSGLTHQQIIMKKRTIHLATLRFQRIVI